MGSRSISWRACSHGRASRYTVLPPLRPCRDADRRNIFAWSGHNYAVEVVKSLDLFESGGVVRVGPVHYNTVAELDLLFEALDAILA